MNPKSLFNIQTKPSGDFLNLSIKESGVGVNSDNYPKANTITKRQMTYFSIIKESKYKSFQEISDSDDYFNLKNFLKMLVMHILYYFLFGPLSLLIIIPIYGKASAYNIFFLRCTRQGFWITSQYFLYIFEIILYASYSNYNPNSNVLFSELMMFLGGYFVLRLLECLTLATMGPNKLKYFSENILNENDLRKERTYAHFKVDNINSVIENEILATLERKNVDLSLFFMGFLGEIDENIKEEFIKIPIIYRNRNNIFKSGSYKFYSGFAIAKILIKNSYDSNYSPKKLKIIAMSLGIIYSLIPSFIRVYTRGSFFGANPIEILLILSLFFLNIYYYYKNCLLVLYSFYEYKSLKTLMTHLENLLTFGKEQTNDNGKIFPTMDFFFPVSIKTWGTLHTIFRDYGKKYKIRVNCYLSMYIFSNFMASSFLILLFYGIKEWFNWAYVIIVGYELVIFAVLAFFTLLEAASINSYFDVHRINIRVMADVVDNLKNCYYFYFELEDQISTHEVYKEGVQRVMSYSEEIFSYFQKKCDINKETHEEILRKSRRNLLSHLSKSLKNIINQIVYATETDQLSVLGFTVTNTLINSLVAFMGSMAFAFIQGVYAKYYEE